PIGPEEVRAPFVHRHDIFVPQLRAHPLLLAPDPGAVRPGRALVPVVELLHPRVGAAIAKRIDVVHDLQQAATARTLIDRPPDGVVARTSGGAPKNGAVGGHGLASRWK